MKKYIKKQHIGYKMTEMKFNFKNCLVKDKELTESGNKLQTEIKNMNTASLKKYEDDRCSINLPDDKEMLSKVKEVIQKKSELNPKYIVVVGIGGSNLGTIAVQEAVLGKLYNQLNPKVKILYSDTVDSDLMDDTIKIIEPVLKKGDNVIINGISKSGGTTETIANFEVVVELLKKYRQDYEKYIVVTSNNESNFWNLGVEFGFDCLEIPKLVGGRYSVFSPVGLFPLGLIGVDLDELLKGAALIKKRCLNKDFKGNPAAISAALLYSNHNKGKTINDMFLFSTDLESIGKWYRQLMGESIGKEHDKDNKQVFNGITPTVSIGSTDLHSMAQLYLGGPHDKYTTFISLENNNSDIKVPNFEKYSKLVDKIQGKPFKVLMGAILKGVQVAFANGKRPFSEIILKDKSENSIGQLLQFKMIEMMYLGYLMNVNPFDQPNVEDYKKETKEILSRG
jgi:glucose-6-phosphate isomerase